MSSHKIKTTHGLVHVTFVGLHATTKPAILLIHGNSSSSKIFKHILASETIRTEYGILACDLPGHGSSDNAIDPESSYTMGGYGSCLLEVLTALSIYDVMILGWSLGGHIALEMIGLGCDTIRIRGVLLVGMPPANGPQVAEAFLGKDRYPRMQLTGQESLSREEAYGYAHEAIGYPFEEWQGLDALRTDGRARRVMFQSFEAGAGVDQVKIAAETTEVLFGVVNGSEETFVNLEYVDKLHWANIWSGRCHKLPGLGHAPFWEAPRGFESLLVEFIKACE